jgi:hypothetical protein
MLSIDIEKLSEEFTKIHLRNLPFYGVIHHFTAPDVGSPHIVYVVEFIKFKW